MSKRSFPNLATSACLLLAFVRWLASCGKESLEESAAPLAEIEAPEALADYPSEITIDNWEQFIEAPKSVIDYLAAQEAAEVQRSKAATKTNRPEGTQRSSSNWIYGSVVAYNGAWTGIAGVTVSQGTCNTNSFAGITPNYYLNVTSGCENAPVCMSYPTDIRNGVSTFDILLISRHIQAIDCFVSPQQYLAADVDRDGDIDNDDMDGIRDLVLFITNNFPTNTPSVRFIPEEDYNDLQFSITGCTVSAQALSAFGFTPDCLARNTNDYDNDIELFDNVNRRVIKTGDVSGNFSF